MTAFAHRPEPAVVYVLGGVAGDAFLRQLQIIAGAPMAARAGNSAVRAVQVVAGLRDVIEYPAFPAVGVVAVRTVASQPSFVTVVGAVTVYACGGRLAKSGGAMAALAGGKGVQAYEREARQVMIETRLRPVVDAVTSGAAASQRAAVHVVDRVAVRAVSCPRARGDLFAVAGQARYLGMATFQWKA